MKRYLTISYLVLPLTLAPVLALGDTNSVSATFTSTIEAGTCTTQVKNSVGAAATDIGFGDVFKSDLEAKSQKENFVITFSGCSGVRGALVNTQISGGCSGESTDGDSYPNSGGSSAATAVEIWNGEPDIGTEFSCNTRTVPQDISISSDSEDLNMTARMVLAKGKTVSDVTAGTFLSPVTFVITYR